MRLLGSAVLATLLGAHAAAPDPAAPGDASPEPVAVEAPTPVPAPAPSAGDLVDQVLPCGLRVLAARDTSLPIAAVVLAIETGSEDDPEGQAGLVHALAYQVLEGNRDIRPHGAAGLVHDAGGLASLGFGPGQIRYEALVPALVLDELLDLESRRLRAVSVNETLWKEALALARHDPLRRWPAPPELRAAAHGSDGLAHEGRRSDPSLDAMVPGAIAAQLADRLTYRHATLAVVSPREPQEVLEQVRALMADLPEAERQVPTRAVTPRAGELRVAGERGTGLALAVPGDPASIERARVLCRGFNRQRPPSGEARRAIVRCTLAEDPRRPLLVFRSGLPDQLAALFRARYESLLAGADRGLLDRQREIVRADLVARSAQPLLVARALTGVTADAQTTVAGAVGRHALDDFDGMVAAIRADLSPDHAVLLLPGKEGR